MHQSFDEIVNSLRTMARDFCQWHVDLSELINELRESGYWDKVPDDFDSQVTYSLQLLKTSCSELQEISTEVGAKVAEHHTVRLASLATAASALDRSLGSVWHSDYMSHFKSPQYGQADFTILERIYADARDSVLTLLELHALAARLTDFVGRGEDTGGVPVLREAEQTTDRVNGKERKAFTWTGVVLTAIVGAVVGLIISRETIGALFERIIASRNTPPIEVTVSSEAIGRFRVEDDGTLQRAVEIFGEPTRRELTGHSSEACRVDWEKSDLTMVFYDLSGGGACDPRYGDFCEARISGQRWRTRNGLKVGDSLRRLWELYPDSSEYPDDGIGRIFVLEEAVAPCGGFEGTNEDLEANQQGQPAPEPVVVGGLEAWVSSGRIQQFKVSFAAGGD
jgi:hypothetical protein